MSSENRGQTDQVVLEELKKPIDDLVKAYYPGSNQYQRLRFRQLAWQAVDALVRTGEMSDLRNHKDIARIIKDVRQLGASEEFIEESLVLATLIYRRLQLDYPALLKRYSKSSS